MKIHRAFIWIDQYNPFRSQIVESWDSILCSLGYKPVHMHGCGRFIIKTYWLKLNR